MACYEYKGVKYTEEELVELLQSQQSKTRRILEVQSDLFQKGRGAYELIATENEILEELKKMGKPESTNFDDIEQARKNLSTSNQNQFLQLLNKDSNWVTFFVKSIIQDSAKKGYEKILFPTGNTASKVEGHSTLEEFKKQKKDRLKQIQPDVILPIGTSGSGKSTFIKSLPQENLVIIEPDAMRVEFTGDMNDKSKDKEIYIEAANRAIQAIKNGKQVVFDTTNLTKDKRLPFIEAIKKVIPTANIQYKLMELNPELAKQRIKAQLARGENRANVSDSTIDRHAESYKQMLEDIKNEPISNYEDNITEINQLKQELERVEREGFGALRPIYNFYENTVTNILRKQGYNPVLITDEYGNTWNEVIVDSKYLFDILLQQQNSTAPQYSESTRQELLNFLYKIDPNFKVEVVDNLSVNALLDLKNRIIQLQTGKESALSEEVAHVFVELLDPKLQKDLISLVTGTKIYNETYNQYKDVYTKDGKPDINKIKREAAAKLLAQAIFASSTNDWSKFNDWSQVQLTGLKLWIKQFMDWINGISFDAFIKYANDIETGNTEVLIDLNPSVEDEIYFQLNATQLKEMSTSLVNYSELNTRVEEAAEFINRTLNNLLKSKSYEDLNKIFGTEEGKFLPKQLIETTRKFMHNINLQSQVAKNFIVTIDRVKDFIDTLNTDVIPIIANRDSDKIKFKEAASVYGSIREWKIYLEALSRDLVNETGELKELLDNAVSSVTTAETKLLNIFQEEVYEYFKEDLEKANSEIARSYGEQITKVEKSNVPNKAELIARLKNEQSKFSWDKKKLSQLLLGHMHDLSAINTAVIGASSTDDPIIALFRKNLDKIMLKNADESVERINEFKKKVDIEGTGLSREDIGKAITKEETELRFNYETNQWEEKKNRYFLNPVNNKAYVDAANLRNKYMEAKTKYKNKEISRGEYFTEKQKYFSFIFKNWNQTYVKEFYEKNFLYNSALYDNYDAEVIEYLQEKIDHIWDEMAILDADIEQNGGIPTIEQEEERTKLSLEYKFLRNPYNSDGTPKTGIDLEAQKIMAERFNWKKEEDFYDYQLNDSQFLREFQYQVDIVDKEDYEIEIIDNILNLLRKQKYDEASILFLSKTETEDSEIVYPAITALHKWFKSHTIVATDPTFYEERQLLIDEIEKVDQQIAQILRISIPSMKDNWNRIFELVAPYRDKDGVVNGQLIPEDLRKVIYDIERKIKESRDQYYKDSKESLKMNLTSPIELDMLYGDKTLGEEGLFAAKKRLIEQLDEFQTREVSDYWESELNSLPADKQEAFVAKTLNGKIPSYIWSKQIKKKHEYQTIKPTGEFYRRKVKDEYKTPKITFKEADDLAKKGIFQKDGKPIIPTVDDFGNWIPITLDNQGKLRGNADYVNQEYFNLKNSSLDSDKKLFKLLKELMTEYVNSQLKLNKSERINYKIPQKVSDIFENPNLKARFKAFTQNLSEKGEGNALLNVVNEWSVLDEAKGFKVDIPLKYSTSIDSPTVDVLESVFEFIEGAEMKVKLHEELPIAQAIEASLSVNPIPNQNRLRKFKGIIERDFQGQTKAYELGGGNVGKKVDNVVRGIMSLTALTRLSIFNPQNNVKNYLAATINTWINFSSKEKLIDSVVTEAYGWANKNLALFMTEGVKSEHNSFEYKLIEYFRPEMKNKFKNYLPSQVKDAIQKGSFLMSGIEFGEYMNTVMTIVAYLKAHKSDVSDKSLFDEITLNEGVITSPSDLEEHRVKIREYLRTWQGNVGSQREAIELDKYTLGSMALFFKRWLVPAIKNNYGSREFNFIRNEVSQGYWNTVGKLLYQNFRTGLRYWRDNWDIMSEAERKNLLKALKQASILLTILGIYMAFGWDSDDKDRFKKLKKASWIKVQLLHLTMSTQSEVSALSPLRLGEFGNEIYKHLKNPFLFLGPIGDMFNVVGDSWNAVFHNEDEARYQRSTGKNKKGDLKLWNRLMKLTPFGKTEDFISKERSIENIRNLDQLTQRIN